MLSDLLPGLIHEINNPLGAIIMNVSIAKEDFGLWKSQGTAPDVDMLQETCQDMDIASERINQILQSLSYFCGARFLEEDASFDVHQALKYALTLYHNKLKRHVKVSVESAEEGYLYLACGPARGILAILLAMETVLAGGGERDVNITVGNEGGRIRVDFHRENGKIDQPDQRLVALARVDDIKLAVRDSGLGLALVAYDPGGGIPEA
jgi:hypothetical protein